MIAKYVTSLKVTIELQFFFLKQNLNFFSVDSQATYIPFKIK